MYALATQDGDGSKSQLKQELGTLDHPQTIYLKKALLPVMVHVYVSSEKTHEIQCYQMSYIAMTLCFFLTMICTLPRPTELSLDTRTSKTTCDFSPLYNCPSMDNGGQIFEHSVHTRNSALL